MFKGLTLLFVVFSFSLPTFSQDAHSCPEGLRYVGTLHGSAAFGEDFNKVDEVKLPENATIDRSYHQSRLTAFSGNKMAKSSLKPGDIPAGIHVVTSGTSDNSKGWSVSEPSLRVVKRNDGTTDYLFGMRLFCTAGHREYDRIMGSCDVYVDVCYKPKT
jgi:hypothetical protein